MFGVKLVGVNAQNGAKLLFSVGLILTLLLLSALLRKLSRWALAAHRDARVDFWTRQGINLGTAVLLIMGLVSVWFDDPARLATALGLVTAGLAFALQKVVTAVAGYFVILRGKTFNVGDRIRMGGVRGDVIALGFIQTTIMEMGQPNAADSDDGAMWVKSRQYSGRVVTISNAKIFDEPVYNYTREFPFIWEEMSIPIPYDADRQRAEQILLEAAERHTVSLRELSEAALEVFKQNYFLERANVKPRVYYRLTDNWLELTVRFVVREHGIRSVKDAMSRDIISAFDAAGIEVASSTYDIVGLPPIRVESAEAEVRIPRPSGA